jgi:dihydroorotase
MARRQLIFLAALGASRSSSQCWTRGVDVTERRPILLTNARVIDPSRNLDQSGDVLIADGVIKEAGKNIRSAGVPEGAEVIDCSGQVIAPGLVDMRAFIGEPGAEHRETLASASQAAAAGGVTTVVCQPETDPPIDDPATVDFVMRRARDTAIVNIHPMAALTKKLEGKEMTEFGLLRSAGAVAFTDGMKSVMNAQVFRRALTYAADFDVLIVHYTEDTNLVGDGVMNEGEYASRLGLLGIPPAAETVMLERDVRLVAETESRYHAASITCMDSLEVLRRAKEKGLPVTASASINHLALNEIDIGSYKTFLKVSPPLRSEEDRRAVVAAVKEGLIDAIVSDHNPQDVEVKRLPFAEAAPGAVGLETMLPVGLRLVHDNSLPLLKLINALSTRPAELLGINGGSLKAGSSADVIVFDPDVPWVLNRNSLKSRCTNSPFDEAKLTGRVSRTIVAGRTVYEYV